MVSPTLRGLRQNSLPSSLVCSAGSRYCQSLKPKHSSWLSIALVQDAIWSSLAYCSLVLPGLSVSILAPPTIYAPLRIRSRILTAAFKALCNLVPSLPSLISCHSPPCSLYSSYTGLLSVSRTPKAISYHRAFAQTVSTYLAWKALPPFTLQSSFMPHLIIFLFFSFF